MKHVIRWVMIFYRSEETIETWESFNWGTVYMLLRMLLLIAITMLHQFDFLITRLIETQKRRFLQEGGIKEQMYKARLQQRGDWSHRSTQRSQRSQSPRSSQIEEWNNTIPYEDIVHHTSYLVPVSMSATDVQLRERGLWQDWQDGGYHRDWQGQDCNTSVWRYAYVQG